MALLHFHRPVRNQRIGTGFLSLALVVVLLAVLLEAQAGRLAALDFARYAVVSDEYPLVRVGGPTEKAYIQPEWQRAFLATVRLAKRLRQVAGTFWLRLNGLVLLNADAKPRQDFAPE